MIEVIQIPILKDNYSYIIIEDESDLVACVDPSNSHEIINFLEDNNLNLNFILSTHHHHDHVGGNLELKKKYNCKIIGNFYDQSRIPGIDIKLKILVSFRESPFDSSTTTCFIPEMQCTLPAIRVVNAM